MALAMLFCLKYMCMCIELDVEYFTFPTSHHSWMNGRHDKPWTGTDWGVTWSDRYLHRRSWRLCFDVEVWFWGLHPLQVQDFHAACGVPTFSDCNAYVKGLLIMVGWPKKKLTRYKYQTLLSISPNQHFRACALTEVLCLQGASCFQGSTSSKFYPRTAGRAYFCHLLRGNLSTIQRKQAPTPNSYIFS